MSIFWLGGPEGIIVPEKDIKFESDEDRYFLPGVIHGGEDYIIQVYYWSNENGPEGDRIGAKYLDANSILEWAKEASTEPGVLNEDVFEELINENAEEFIVLNDGTGDFVTLNNSYNESVSLGYEEIISWANEVIDKAKISEIKLSLDEQIKEFEACKSTKNNEKPEIKEQER